MSEALSVVASLVTIAGGLYGVSNYLRSRRRVRISTIPVYSSSADPRLTMTVVNVGVQPVTITFLGWSVVDPPSGLIQLSRLFLYPLFARWIDRQHTDGPRYDVLGEDVDTGPITVALKHGEQHVESIPISEIAGSLDEGRCAWPMALDTLGQAWFADRPADVSPSEARSPAPRRQKRRRAPKRRKAESS